MAQPTDTRAPHAPAMAATPGITPAAAPPPTGNRAGGSGTPSMGPPPGTDSPGMPPILWSDIEPVHFVRLYPKAVSEGGKAASDAALAAGKATAEAATHLVAAQQEPVDYKGEA